MHSQECRLHSSKGEGWRGETSSRQEEELGGEPSSSVSKIDASL